MRTDRDLERGWTEAGRLLSTTETPRARAERLLVELLPRFANRDEALNNLYFVNPKASLDIRIFSIAAALYIMGTDPKIEKP